jgi:dihydroxy-acid dehydratase
MRVLHASGGSTNAILHLIALSGRVDGQLDLSQINSLGEGLSVIADVEPSGSALIQEFDKAGGLPVLIAQLGEKFELEEETLIGKKWREIVEGLKPASEIIRSLSHPIFPEAAFRVLHGSLAPNGCIMKVSAASKALFSHKGPAVVFHGYADMRNRIDDPALEVTRNSVLVLKGCGAVGVPGMPEWGMIPIPKKLLEAGVTDMVRISDARMSGTSFGTCVLHVSPEAAVGGPLAIVRDGDVIEINVERGVIDLCISAEELAGRLAKWLPPVSEHLRGWPALYQSHVLQADQGCDLDFLRPTSKEARRFVPPVVGRS